MGGGEVTDFYLMSKEQADKVADFYIKEGYDDVVVEEVANV